MPISFPTSPALNQTFTTNDGNFYRYNGKGWVRSSPNYSTIANGSITGNLIALNTITPNLISNLTTSNVSELGNLYFSSDRVYTNVIIIGYSSNTYVNTRLLTKANVADLTTTNVTEGTNFYFTNARAAIAIANATISNITVSGNVVAGNFNTSGVVTANAVTAFKAGDGAISGVALEIPREGGIRNLFNGDNSIYYDVSIGGSTHGHHIFRGSSSYTQYAKIDNNGIEAITSYKGKTSFNIALDTEVTVDNLKFRISNQGGIFPQVGNASGSNVDLCWSAMAVVSGGSVSAQNTGVIVSAGSWTSIYTAHGLDTRGDTIVAHITDKNSGKIYRVTYLVTNNSSNTTGYNILVERII